MKVLPDKTQKGLRLTIWLSFPNNKDHHIASRVTPDTPSNSNIYGVWRKQQSGICLRKFFHLICPPWDLNSDLWGCKPASYILSYPSLSVFSPKFGLSSNLDVLRLEWTLIVFSKFGRLKKIFRPYIRVAKT